MEQALQQALHILKGNLTTNKYAAVEAIIEAELTNDLSVEKTLLERAKGRIGMDLDVVHFLQKESQ